MTACPATDDIASAGIGQALRVIDCMTGEAAQTAFARLFGSDGRLLGALTILLTIYVALMAIALLTGRARLGLATLTPRMLALGLVLTFATSWAAYQAVVWNLASGAPDQVAGLLLGGRGSATLAFADRLDALFVAVADAARAAGVPASPSETGITPAAATVGGFSASTVLWVSALMLLIGTVCVLLTARIVLAALLALGPLFIVLALFRGTRGLFEGWLKAATLFALVPLLTVLIGGAMLAAIAPLARGIAMAGGQPEPQPVAALFVAAVVYLALMTIVLKTAGTMIAGWRLPWTRDPEPRAAGAVAATPVLAAPPAIGVAGMSSADERVRALVAALPRDDGYATTAAGGFAPGAAPRRLAAPMTASAPIAVIGFAPPGSDDRARAMRRLGSRPVAPRSAGSAPS